MAATDRKLATSGIEEGKTGDISSSPSPHQLTSINNDKKRKEDKTSIVYKYPRWLTLTKMASDIRVFVVIICFYWLVQTMLAYYTVAMLTTIEKRFGWNSTYATQLLTIREIAFVLVVTFMSHFAGLCHRPRVLALAGFIGAIGGVLYAMPNFVYTEKLHSLNTTWELSDADFSCRPRPLHSDDDECDKSSIKGQKDNSFYFLMFGALILGLTATPVSSLSQTYVDDAVGPRRAALFLGFMYMMRPMGPVVAFLLGGAFTSLHETLTDPGFDQTDPRWIGAWWIGYIVIPCLFLLPVVFLLMFPAKIPLDPVKDADYITPNNDQPDGRKEGQCMKDFCSSLLALLRNPVYMCLQLGGCLGAFTISGLFPFIPKYMEVMFNLPTSTANIITALASSLMAALGVLVGGLIAARLRFTPRQMGLVILVLDVLYTAIILILMVMQCPDIKMAPLQSSVNSTCLDTCHCLPDQFHPVCGDDQLTYLSPCEARCTVSHENNTWSECGCVSSNISNLTTIQRGARTVTSRSCTTGCTTWISFSVILAVGAFVLFLPTVPGATLVLRIVREEHRSIAFGFSGTLFAFTSFVPGPMLFGAIIDSCCSVWKQSCGQTRDCLIYDKNLFKLRAILTATGFSAASVIFYVAMYVLLRRKEQQAGKDLGSKETVVTHF